MRDISNKVVTQRIAVARSVLMASMETIEKIRNNEIPKGDPLPVAKIAAIQAAKNTSQIIPYCHPVRIDFVGVEFELQNDRIEVLVTVKSNDKTGVEMEALAGASVATLTLYDMMKMLDEAMRIESTELVSKKGGKSDFKQPFFHKLNAAVVVVSDSVSAGKKEDTAGRLITERLEAEGLQVSEYQIISDDPTEIKTTIEKLASKTDLILTTGGTGVSPRDNTPDVVQKLLTTELPGICEAMRGYGQERTPYAMLSRSVAGLREKTLIITLPGSKGGVKDGLDALFPAVLHTYKMLWGYGHTETESRDKQPETAGV